MAPLSRLLVTLVTLSVLTVRSPSSALAVTSSASPILAESPFCKDSALACKKVGHSHSLNSDTRKSLRFGPSHKHQQFASFVYDDGHHSSHADAMSMEDKFSAALDLAHTIVGVGSSKEGSMVKFYVRPDSYIDPESGLSYIYVKQTINGLLVDDANLNAVFAQNGQLLSYGSSLYKGAIPDAFVNPVDTQTFYTEDDCKLLRSKIEFRMSQMPFRKRDQLVFSPSYLDDDTTGSEKKLSDLQRELYLNCDDPSDSPFLQDRNFGSRVPGSLGYSHHHSIMDAKFAALNFVQMATTDQQLQAQLSSSLEQTARTITSTFHQSARPDGCPEQVEKLHNVPGTTNIVQARLGYTQTEEGELSLVWRMLIPMDFHHNSNFYEVTIDATSGSVRSSADWVASAPTHIQQGEDEVEAQYKVIRWGLNDPSEGNRTLEIGAQDHTASPYGWHEVPGKASFNDTRGNNVIASAFGAGMEDYLEPQRPRPTGKKQGQHLLFEFPFPWRAADRQHEELDPAKYADASTVNLFYTLNKYHDLLYRYGFTPASGNFEEAESSEGGRGGDPIVAYAISSAGINNADFTTPPDGSKPRVRMYKFHTKENATERDGDFEGGIIIHEMTHGLSTRLTGGPSDSSCLGWGESGGMGEGWGDLLATLVRRKSPTRDIFTMGSWASHAKSGIRKYPYSTNLTLNPETYKSLDAPGYWGVHAIGEVWAGILYQVEEGLRAQHGWSPDLFPPGTNASQQEKDAFFLTADEIKHLLGPKGRPSKRPVPRHGNTLAVQLIIDGMKLQPCRPSFFDARDAIIQADQHLTGGSNACLLWERFAQRGLGVNAKVVGRTPWGGGVRTNGYKKPSKCK